MIEITSLNEAKRKKPEEDDDDSRYELEDEPNEEETDEDDVGEPDDEEDVDYNIGDDEGEPDEEEPDEEELDDDGNIEDTQYELGDEDEPDAENVDDEDTGEESDLENDDGGNYDMDDEDPEGEGDEGTPDGETDDIDDSASQHPDYIDINNIESEVASQILNNQELLVRKNNLKKLFKNLYDSIEQYINKLSNMSIADSEEEKQVNEIINQLKEAKVLLIDYVSDVYDIKSYTENLTQYYQYIALLENIFAVIKMLNDKHK
jgi:hypothetical protein